jgi:polyphenol oxidase
VAAEAAPVESAGASGRLRPSWSNARVGALMTTRVGGVSRAPYDSMNLKDGIGDDPIAVEENRQILQRQLGDARPVWLHQVHGCRVVRLRSQDAAPGAPLHEADASITTEPGIGCFVQVADCLPVLLCVGGQAVGAAHAGWRGLASGVVEKTLDALCDAAGCRPGDVEAWLGACIGPAHFEVGADVVQAFGGEPASMGAGETGGRFTAREAPGKWLADLAGLAHDRLARAGVQRVGGHGGCTFADRSRFFSYRRDGVTGRMAAGIWLQRPA